MGGGEICEEGAWWRAQHGQRPELQKQAMGPGRGEAEQVHRGQLWKDVKVTRGEYSVGESWGCNMIRFAFSKFSLEN